ncbi:MAG: FISUMP domain-containing protein [Bacteroidota bacterium]|nr:FISUMP domain-containing protein [Bacteroidota bacterium]
MKNISYKLITITIFLFFSLVNYSQPSSWNWVNTGVNHTISVYYSTIFTIDDSQSTNMDYWIGVFFTDINGELQCGGYYQWTVNNNIAISAWGEDGYGLPGFRPGEEFVFKVFTFNGQDSIIYDSHSTFWETYPYTGTNTYFTNGYSSFKSLKAISPRSVQSQVIQLLTNWSIFSTYLIPLHNDISLLLNPVNNNLVLVKDGNGQVYWPFFGLNMIGNIAPGKGYQIKMAAADTLHVEGSLINPNVFELELQAGWDIIGYILTKAKPVEDVLLPIINNVEIVKDYNGNVYWPVFGLNMIGNMYPGQGYQIKTSVADTLIFGESRDIAALCPPTVSDFDGNQYNTVLIGHQCWLAENLKTSHYSTGDSIPNVTNTYNWENLSTNDLAWSYYDNSSSYGNTYGALYTWAAAMNGAQASGSGLNRIQGICPNGWYLPAERDWEELADYINLQNGYYERDLWFWKGVGGHLKSTTNWYYYGIGTDDYSFTGQAAGKRDYEGQFSLLTESGYWWTASQTNSDLARVRKLFYRNDNFFNFDHKKENGFSVRCLLDTCTVYPYPAAIAGSDSLNMPDTSIILQGNTPLIGTGCWSVVNGTGGIISDENNPNSIFSGLENHEYKLVWSISNGCGYSGDTISVSFQCLNPPSQANAGPDHLNLIDTFTILQANTPIMGIGHWVIISGTNGTISDINNPSAQFSGLHLHEYCLVWTIGNVCYNTYDTVSISFSCGLPPSLANAGIDQINLPDTFTVLQADTPTIGIGHWELIDGIGGVIANSINPSSAFSGIQGHEYLLTWTVENKNQCEASIDTVLISFLCLAPPNQANAGNDQLNLVDTFAILQANTPVNGPGTWIILSGTGGEIMDINNPQTQFSGLALHVYQLAWTIGNLCWSTTDTVSIGFSCGLPPTQANAGPDQLNLVDTFTNLQANTAISGTGE